MTILMVVGCGGRPLTQAAAPRHVPARLSVTLVSSAVAAPPSTLAPVRDPPTDDPRYPRYRQYSDAEPEVRTPRYVVVSDLVFDAPWASRFTVAEHSCSSALVRGYSAKASAESSPRFAVRGARRLLNDRVTTIPRVEREFRAREMFDAAVEGFRATAIATLGVSLALQCVPAPSSESHRRFCASISESKQPTPLTPPRIRKSRGDPIRRSSDHRRGRMA